MAGLGIDADDVVGLPNVGVNSAVDVFQFIETDDGGALFIEDGDLMRDFQRVWIEEVEIVGAVTHDKLLAVVGKPPAFCGVGEGVEQFEAVLVVDKAGLVLPGELVDFVVEDGDAFSKILFWNG